MRKTMFLLMAGDGMECAETFRCRISLSGLGEPGRVVRILNDGKLSTFRFDLQEAQIAPNPFRDDFVGRAYRAYCILYIIE